MWGARPKISTGRCEFAGLSSIAPAFLVSLYFPGVGVPGKREGRGGERWLKQPWLFSSF
jgi:hypothetical protein